MCGGTLLFPSTETSSGRLLQRSVSITLECILVVSKITSLVVFTGAFFVVFRIINQDLRAVGLGLAGSLYNACGKCENVSLDIVKHDNILRFGATSSLAF